MVRKLRGSQGPITITEVSQPRPYERTKRFSRSLCSAAMCPLVFRIYKTAKKASVERDARISCKKRENETSRFRHHSPDNFVTLEKMRSTLLHRDATVKSRKELAYPSFFNYSNLVREQLTISKYRNLVVCA